MKKKSFVRLAIISSLILASLSGAVLFFTNGFSVGRITGKVYNAQNVYDEIWNLMIREKRGEKTVLTDSSGAGASFEFGTFSYIDIPECKANLSFSSGKLSIIIRTGEFFTETVTEKTREKYVLYEYDPRTKVLSIKGAGNEDLLSGSFLSYYFRRQASRKSKPAYSTGEPGNYSVIINDSDGYVLSLPVNDQK